MWYQCRFFENPIKLNFMKNLQNPKSFTARRCPCTSSDGRIYKFLSDLNVDFYEVREVQYLVKPLFHLLITYFLKLAGMKECYDWKKIYWFCICDQTNSYEGKFNIIYNMTLEGVPKFKGNFKDTNCSKIWRSSLHVQKLACNLLLVSKPLRILTVELSYGTLIMPFRIRTPERRLDVLGWLVVSDTLMKFQLVINKFRAK